MICCPVGYGFTSRRLRGQRLAGDRQAVAVEQPRLEQCPHQRLDAADPDQLRHRVPAARPQVRQHGHAAADPGEIVERERDAARHARSRAGAARRWSSRTARWSRRSRSRRPRASGCPRVGCRGGSGRRRLDPPARHRRACGARRPPAPSCSRGSCPAPRSPRPSCWRCTCRRSCPGPGMDVRSTSRSSRSLIAPCARAPTASNTETMSRRSATWTDRAAIDEHRRPIEPRDRHQATRHVLVAAPDRDQAVEALRPDDRLDRVGDHLA